MALGVVHSSIGAMQAETRSAYPAPMAIRLRFNRFGRDQRRLDRAEF